MMEFVTSSKGFSAALDKAVADTQKKIRHAAYITLEKVAERGRNALIANYPKKFKDENGIIKNKGVPKQVTKSKVNKTNLSIELFTKDSISFMYDQQYGGERTGKGGAKKAVPFLKTQQIGRTSKGTMKKGFQISTLMKKALDHETAKRTGGHKPKPFIMTARSGHKMLSVRLGKARTPIQPLYHFDKKTKIRPRWDFVKTVEGVTVHYIDKTFEQCLKKEMEK